ncbi:MAG: hypothetical protein V1646_02495 [bacterium]
MDHVKHISGSIGTIVLNTLFQKFGIKWMLQSILKSVQDQATIRKVRWNKNSAHDHSPYLVFTCMLYGKNTF